MKAAGVAAVMIMSVAGPSEVAAQESSEGIYRSPSLVLHGGWGLAEVDSLDAGMVIGLELEFPLATWAMLAPRLDRREVGYPDETRAEWMIDFAFQATHAFGRLEPYAGVALGAAFDFRDERDFTESFVVATYGGNAGLRYRLTERFGIRTDARYRFIDGFNQGALQGTAGISWHF